MSDAPLILLIEDEAPIRKFVRAALVEQGYRVVEAETGKQGLTQAMTQPPDVVLLDLGLPDADGLDIAKRLREWSSVPILILSARGQERDKVAALDAGADDYLTKPFGVGELLARVRVAMRHSVRFKLQDEPVFNCGDLAIDLVSRVVRVRDEVVHLTPIEYRLLTTLARHTGKVVTHATLLREVWGPNAEQDTPYLRVFMGQLRRKIEREPAQPRYLLTEQGVGYRLAAE